MSGEIEITPGYQFPDGLTKQTHARLNQLGNPTARLAAGSVTERELADSIEFGDKRSLALVWEDFLNANDSIAGANAGTVGSAKLSARAGSSGSIAAVAAPTTGPCAGVLRLRVLGSGASNWSMIRGESVPQCYPASGAISMKARLMIVNATSVLTPARMQVGLGNPANSDATPTDGAWVYIEGGGNFSFRTSASSVTSSASHSDGPDLNTWFTLEVQINAAGTEAKFLVDGVLAGTISTNIPTSTTGLVLMIINKSETGYGNTDLMVDYTSLSVAFETAR